MTETALDPVVIDRLTLTGADHRGNERPLAVVTMLVTLYVPRGDEPVARQAVAALVDGYVAVAGPHLRWAGWGDERLKDLRKQSLPSCVERTRGLPADQSFEITLSGADDFDDASPFGLRCRMPRRRPPPHMGCLSASFPLGFLDHQPPGWFFKWVAAACAQLRPIHGYAGLGLIRSMDGGTAQLASPRPIHSPSASQASRSMIRFRRSDCLQGPLDDAVRLSARPARGFPPRDTVPRCHAWLGALRPVGGSADVVGIEIGTIELDTGSYWLAENVLIHRPVTEPPDEPAGLSHATVVELRPRGQPAGAGRGRRCRGLSQRRRARTRQAPPAPVHAPAA